MPKTIPRGETPFLWVIFCYHSESLVSLWCMEMGPGRVEGVQDVFPARTGSMCENVQYSNRSYSEKGGWKTTMHPQEDGKVTSQ